MGVAEFIYTTLLKPPWLKALANKVILALLPKSVTIGNAIVILNPQDPVVSGALAFGVYEKHEIEFMRRVLAPGQIMLDIGANLGLYTALGGRVIGDRGRVIAFEPDPQSLIYLHQTIDANALANVEVVEAAAANVNGTTNLYISSINRGDNRLYANRNSDNVVEVATHRVDSVLRQRGIDKVDVIKIDVQGFEGQVIEGMQQILEHSAAVKMLMEFWPDGLRAAGTDPLELLDRLQAWQLSVFELKDGGRFVSIDDRAHFVERFPGRAYTNIVALGADATASG